MVNKKKNTKILNYEINTIIISYPLFYIPQCQLNNEMFLRILRL